MEHGAFHGMEINLHEIVMAPEAVAHLVDSRRAREPWLSPGQVLVAELASRLSGEQAAAHRTGKRTSDDRSLFLAAIVAAGADGIAATELGRNVRHLTAAQRAAVLDGLLHEGKIRADPGKRARGISTPTIWHAVAP